ncbi:MAG: ABC transporter permease [Lachnospiraceae bacterium]|jgi:ABC-2 type transport system permease protein|nr:ABC transporter permease [Lachnospiraceae bacterium]
MTFGKMMQHSIKISLRNREVLTWTLIFPLLMSTLFYFAFSSLDEANQLEAVPVAIVENAEYRNSSLEQMLREISEGEEPLLALQSCESAEEAAGRLEEGEIAGYIDLEDQTPRLTVKEEGMNQTILRQVLTQYQQMWHSISGLTPQQAAAVMEAQQGEQESMLERVSLTHNPPSDMVGYFYSLLAMVCLFGMYQGIISVYNLQANQSALGIRRCIAPESYIKVMLAEILSGSLLHILVVWIALAYMVLVLKINFGGRVLLAMAGCAAGSLTGVSLGVFVGSFPKMNVQMKIGASTVVSLFLCFCSGMMVGGINYWIQEYIPIFAWLNPAMRLVDAMHSLYYFDTIEPFLLNTAILLLFSVVFFALSALRLRRYQYESV